MPPPSLPRQIPGYYYDADKGKYFKVEKAATAPTSAAWSADNVKRRRIEDKQAAARQHQAQRNKARPRRARVLAAPLTGGFLARELGDVRRDVVPSGFATGLVSKGCLPLADARWGGASAASRRNVQHMYIDGQDTKTGVCVAFSTIDGDSLVSTYVPRDQNGRVHRRLLADYHTPSTHIAPYQEITVSQISDIKCHEPSNQILITCRSPGPDVSMWAFAPRVTEPEDPRPNWLLSWNGSSVYRCIRTPGRGGTSSSSYQANTVAPAPSGLNLLGLIGTNSGIVQWHDNSSTDWWTPTSPLGKPNPFRDVFSIDFQMSNPQVAFFGGRPGSLWIGDLRTPAETWDSVSIPSSITHIRSVRQHQVLVAGLKNTLALHDLRFRKPQRQASDSNVGNRHNRRGGSNSFSNHGKNADRPLLRFREYRNAAHVDIGLDFDPASGVVAAAHDDGKVALYSVHSGHRLSVPSPGGSLASPLSSGIDQIRSERGPIQSIQWQMFPRDHASSLFVGVQSNINVYSFGVHDFQDEA